MNSTQQTSAWWWENSRCSVSIQAYTHICLTPYACMYVCKHIPGWPGGVMVSASDLRSRGPRFDSRPVHCQATTLGKLLTPVCLCHQALQFGTGQMAVMLCGREGNSRSGVALAMCHRLQWFIHLWAHGQGKGDEHPTYVNLVMVRFTFYIPV